MSRPCKKRRICMNPFCNQFGPTDSKPQNARMIEMTVDEYESIRIIDLEGLSQEDCAVRMNVARTTAQAIYNSARVKIAECLVNGLVLKIIGGNYELCDGTAACSTCRKINTKTYEPIEGKKDNVMRIAVTYENGQIFQHFGKTEEFKIYDVEDGKIVHAQVMGTDGKGHGALAGVLAENDVEVLICGGIGGGAQEALADAGIQIYGGVMGDADEAVTALLKKELIYNPDVKCNHHHDDHHEGGCGEHHDGGCGGHHEGGCGEHGCK